jgi:dihydrofolate synthase/folylpolyglutamate synthase
MFTTETDAVTYIFTSLANSNWRARGLDEHTRDLAPTRALLARLGLPAHPRQYAVVTGSKGKGSATTLTARILREHGHTVGSITSPHLVSYRERIRINGQAIPLPDFLRLVNTLRPDIDAVMASLPPDKYLSPQGIFLAMALRWFDENRCDIAVIEVGRGGRFDDNALVPNHLGLFTPIVLEHARYLGPTPARIAWHKAGILKPGGLGLSLPQTPDVQAVLEAEAAAFGAHFHTLSHEQMGVYVRDHAGGVVMRIHDTEIDLPFYGRYEIDNASLAIAAADVLHQRTGAPAPLPFDRTCRALSQAVWPGRLEKLADAPAVYIDGAINVLSLRSFIASVQNRLTAPVVVVSAVPTDRDIPAVFGLIAGLADAWVITASPRNITISFPDSDSALSAARQALQAADRPDVPLAYRGSIAEAIPLAQQMAGPSGTVLMPVAQPAIGDVMEFFGRSFDQI